MLSSDEQFQQQRKINIFQSQQEITGLKALTYGEKKSIQLETRSQSSVASLVPLDRPKSIEYLKLGKNEGKESTKEFISLSRQILMSQIAIKDKTDEN